MRIAIEASPAQRKVLTGFGHYVVELLKALGRVAPENEYLLLHSNEEWKGPDFGPSFRPVSYYRERSPLGVLMNLNQKLKKERADLFHATCTTGVPPDPPIPCVATIHDIYPLLHPYEAFSPPTHLYRMLVEFSARHSRHFICNSEFTAREFGAEYGIPPELMTCVHLAPALPVEKLSWPWGRPKDSYILCAGAIERRKGQLILLEAYRRLCERNQAVPPLKFIGPDRGDGEQLEKCVAAFELGNKVEWLRYVSSNALAGYYRSAACFAFPSTYEGFGIPLVEAAAAGIPALCSDIEVFHEIAGDYPLFVKPEPRAMADALASLLRGDHDAHFKTAARPSATWDGNAKATLDCYRKALA